MDSHGSRRKKFNPAVSKLLLGGSPDRLILPFDIIGTRAHIRAIARAGIINSSEKVKLLSVLEKAGEYFEANDWAYDELAEDCHMALEAKISELCDDKTLASKVHTGRSRNDQVVTALTLYAKSMLIELKIQLLNYLESLIKLSEKAFNKKLIIPGYTHLQRGQPVLLAHHLLAHAWPIKRDLATLDFVIDSLNESPLGAGAVAGSTFLLDEKETAKELGFEEQFNNSIDVVANRDFILDILFVTSKIATHLCRFANEVVIWCSSEFSYITLGYEVSSTSSMMPQKKNPDTAEIVRGRSSLAISNLLTGFMVLKDLPYSYSRDLSVTKKPMYDSFEKMFSMLPALTSLVESIEFNDVSIAKSCEDELLAITDFSDQFVFEGLPFRKAHQFLGALVRYSREKSILVSVLIKDIEQDDDLKSFMVAKLQNEELVAQAIEILAKPAFKTKILSMLNEPGISCVNSKVGYGSTSIDSVNEQIKNLKNVIRDNNG
ncbi:MAG: argininosuccinate lyase [Acidimicrobiia bacterium]